jgi:hypothetical protein
MRLSNIVTLALALSSLAGCASSTSQIVSRDASVRVEPRRVSAATAEDPGLAKPVHHAF